jgi:hypothetical protein
LGPRALSLATACLYAVAAACGPARGANTAAAPPLSAASGAPDAGTAAPEATVDLDPEGALGLGPGDGEILVRTSVLRGHPVGAHIGPVLRLWPGWGSTLHAISRNPVADLDWIDVVGPSDLSRERMLVRVSDSATDAAIDGRLVALQARSAEPAASHVEGRIVAAAARLDGVLRVVFRPQAHFVAATAAQSGPALSHLLARTRVRAPATEPLEAVRIDRFRPHDAVRLIPEGIRRMRVRVLALANGDADASADGDCDGAADAANAATALRDTIARQNFSLVRMLTHGLLDAIAVTSEGSVVKLHLHASRDQLDAVLALVTAMAPADTAP